MYTVESINTVKNAETLEDARKIARELSEREKAEATIYDDVMHMPVAVYGKEK